MICGTISAKEDLAMKYADALTLASEKLKDTFNDNTEWFGLEEEQEDTEEE